MASGRFEKINLDLLFEHASNLPSSPRIFARLSQLVSKEDTSLDYVSSLIKMDPALAAQVLRVTNSAYFSLPTKIDDVGTAISRIGFIELKKILDTVIASDNFFQALPAYGITATEFSDDSVDVAVAAEILAKRTGFDSNVLYITGLLHNIGMLAINLYLERMNQMENLVEKAGDQALIEYEKERLGYGHYRIAAELLSLWKFPPNFAQTIRNQENPLHAQTQRNATQLLALAIWATSQLSSYDSEEKRPEHIDKALSELGIDPLDIPNLLDDCRFEINDRKNMLAMLL